MLAGFITPRIILHYYGSEINGLVTSILQFISYFSLIEAGLSGATIYALYKPLAQQDYDIINGIVSAAKKFYTKAGYIFLALITVLAIIYPINIKSDFIGPIEISILVFILGASGVVDFFTLSKYRTLLTADQKTYIISIASIIQVIFNTIVVVIGASFLSIVVLRAVALSSIFVRSFILYFYVKLKYKRINYKVKPIASALNKRWDVLYLQILGVIQKSTPVLVITIVLRDLKLASVYAIFNMVVTGINGILNIFNSGLAASFGDVIAKKEQVILQRAYNEFEFSYYYLITVVYSVMLITIMPFIRIYTHGITDVNYYIPIFGVMITLNSLFYNLKTPQGMIVISAGLFKETKWQTTTQGAIAIIGSIVFSLWYGLVGVIIGMVLSNIYRSIDLLFFIPKHVTKLPVGKTFRRWIKMALDITIIYITNLFFQYQPSGYLNWILFATCVGLYALFVVTITSIIFEKPMLIAIIHRITKTRGKTDDTIRR
jgi:O-antigen/teichoic acid export membrane protein